MNDQQLKLFCVVLVVFSLGMFVFGFWAGRGIGAQMAAISCAKGELVATLEVQKDGTTKWVVKEKEQAK